MEYIIGAVWLVLELTYYHLFVGSFLAKAYTRNKFWIGNVVIGTSLYIFTNVVYMGSLQQAITLLLYIALSFFLYHGHWLRHLLVGILVFLFSGAIDTVVIYGVSLFLQIRYTDLIWKMFTYVSVVTIGKLLEIFIAYLIRYFRQKDGIYAIRGKWLGLMLLFPAISLTAVLIVFIEYKQADDLSLGAFILCILLGLANIASIYLVQAMEKSTRTEQEMALVDQQMKLQTESILELERNYRQQRQSTHEYRRQLQTICDLIDSCHPDAARDYIRELQAEQAPRLFVVNSNHPIVDVILNSKYQKAKENNIEMQIWLNDLAGINIPTNALVVVLSNLLDNAIEACLRLPENREIHCRLVLDGSLFLSVRNTSAPVAIRDGQIATSKEGRRNHGYGLIGVRNILDSLRGEYTYHYDDGWFQFTSEIPQ